jgi:hypothetical protein
MERWNDVSSGDGIEAYRRAKVLLHVDDQQRGPEGGVGHGCG